MEKLQMQEQFAAVWDRVAPPGENPEAGHLARALQGLLRETEAAGDLYRRLARRCTAREDARRLLTLARQKKERLAQLRALLFLLEGDAAVPAFAPLPIVSTLDALRRACLAEQVTAQACRQAANHGDKAAAVLLFGLAGEAEHNAQTLQAMLARALRG